MIRDILYLLGVWFILMRGTECLQKSLDGVLSAQLLYSGNEGNAAVP